jgi:light-regulated signal transduction histidine kinase (bacteriophytochrome)
MGNAKDLFRYESLAFFGKVNASISHELKNVMAIISETAGLLSDLSEMASTGATVAPEMLNSCTTSIVEEIQRGFATIRQMHRFAHSVDTPVQSVNLMDVIDLVVNLASYLSFAGETRIIPCKNNNPTALTCPFLLQAVVYQALVYTFENTGPGAEITISIQPQNDQAWCIIFSGFNAAEFHVFPDDMTQRMAESIFVTICWDSTADRLELVVPKKMENIDKIYSVDRSGDGKSAKSTA